MHNNVFSQPSRFVRMPRLIAVCILLAAGFFALLSPAIVRANKITVTNTGDSGAGSLRQAILDAASGDTITFSSDISGTILLTSGELMLTKDATIQGPGANVLAIDGNNTSRVFHVQSGATVTVSDLTIQHGRSANGLPGNATSNATFGENGGAINNEGALTIVNCVVVHNRTGDGGGGVYGFGGGNGGGIANTGTLIVMNTTVTANTTGAGGAGSYRSGGGGNGGGIYNGNSLSVIASTIADNATSDGMNANSSGFGGAGGFGGGIQNDRIATVINSTIASNHTGNGGSGETGGPGGNGGGISNSLFSIDSSITLNVTSSTITSNVTGIGQVGGGGGAGDDGRGGGICNAGSLTLSGSLIAHNIAGGRSSSAPDLWGTLSDRGYNLLGTTMGTSTPGGGFPTTDRLNVAPGLATDTGGEPLLADNGGATPTIALLPGSPAIDAGGTSADGCPATDQRDVSRPQGVACDIGAFEAQIPSTRPSVHPTGGAMTGATPQPQPASHPTGTGQGTPPPVPNPHTEITATPPAVMPTPAPQPMRH